MLRAHRSLVLLLCAVLLTITGCASSQVRLRYVPTEELPAVTFMQHENIGLVQFTDARPTQILGIDKGKELTAVSNVAAWVTRGLEKELKRQGATVTYVLSTQQITDIPTRVTGTISKLQITPLSAGEYRGELTLTIAINDDLPTTYKATVVKQGVPYTNIIEPLLAELLQEAIAPAVPTILAAQ